jgi:hypothetical protein
MNDVSRRKTVLSLGLTWKRGSDGESLLIAPEGAILMRVVKKSDDPLCYDILDGGGDVKGHSHHLANARMRAERRLVEAIKG